MSAIFDILRGRSRYEKRIHDQGFVALIDVMPRLVPDGQTADQAIVQAARVSYGDGTKTPSDDRSLIRYLMRHHHTTPFEMVEFKFHCAMPIFVARQWIRHRTANVNEYSGRYSVMPDRFYRPTADGVREQSASNKQGGDASVDVSTAESFLAYLHRAEELYGVYQQLVVSGVSRELARIGLPQSLYTEWYWKIDLHNLLRFLTLRMDPHSQKEIRDYATAMHDLISPIVPITMEAWRDYELNSMRLTWLEVEAIQLGATRISSSNKREIEEWKEKRKRLGLDQGSPDGRIGN